MRKWWTVEQDEPAWDDPTFAPDEWPSQRLTGHNDDLMPGLREQRKKNTRFVSRLGFAVADLQVLTSTCGEITVPSPLEP